MPNEAVDTLSDDQAIIFQSGPQACAEAGLGAQAYQTRKRLTVLQRRRRNLDRL